MIVIIWQNSFCEKPPIQCIYEHVLVRTQYDVSVDIVDSYALRIISNRVCFRNQVLTIMSSCTLKLLSISKRLTSHVMTSPLSDTEANVLRQDDTATTVTGLVCPTRLAFSWRSIAPESCSTVHTAIVQSRLAVRRVLESKNWAETIESVWSCSNTARI